MHTSTNARTSARTGTPISRTHARTHIRTRAQDRAHAPHAHERAHAHANAHTSPLTHMSIAYAMRIEHVQSRNGGVCASTIGVRAEGPRRAGGGKPGSRGHSRRR
eukprot:2516820-Pleurochrysis_carterae.AAC.2